MADNVEQRKHPRVPLDAKAPAVFLDLELSTAAGPLGTSRIINIAEEGLFLATEVSLESGRAFALTMTMADGSAHCARGKVVWQGPNGVGVRFDDPKEAFREFIRSLAAADLEERWALLQGIVEAEGRLDELGVTPG